MDLVQKINNDIKEAMKSAQAMKLGTLRLLASAIHNREIEKKAKSKEAITEAEVMDVLKKEVKKRRESIDIYGKAGRNDLKDKEVEELAIIQSYLPPELTDEVLEGLVKKALSIGAKAEKDFGKAMKLAMAEVKGQAEAGRVSAIVKKLTS